MTYTLKIKEENATANAILEIIKKLPFFEIKEEQEDIYLPKNLDELIEQSRKDLENGDTITVTAENLWDNV